MGAIDHLGYIKEALYYPCAQPNAELMIQAAGNAIGPVLLAAGSFGCLDIIKMRAGISPWHSRGIKAFVEHGIKPHEFDEIRKLYKFLIPLEKALFVFWIADLEIDFFARWHSQAFKLGACGAPHPGCNYGGPVGAWVAGEPNHMRPIEYRTTWTNSQCAGGGGARFTVRPGEYWSCFFSLTPEPIFSGQTIGYSDTMLKRIFPSDLNYPTHRAEPPWFGNPVTSFDHRTGHNPSHGTQEFEMNAATDVPARAKSGSCTIEISDVPIYTDGILPVNCFGRPFPEAPLH